MTMTKNYNWVNASSGSQTWLARTPSFIAVIVYFPSFQPPLSSGIVQLAMFDDTGQAVDRHWGNHWIIRSGATPSCVC